MAAEDSLVTLESDKATMDVPSPSAGTVKSVSVKVGDKVSEGTVIVVLDVAEAGAAKPAAAPAACTREETCTVHRSGLGRCAEGRAGAAAATGRIDLCGQG